MNRQGKTRCSAIVRKIGLVVCPAALVKFVFEHGRPRIGEPVT